MNLTPDWQNRILDSSTSLTDIVAFHVALRALEASPEGILYPAIHRYRAVDLGGGSSFYAVDFINGWQLRFPNPGSYQIIGNVTATIVPTAGVFLTATKALAFATVSGGSSGGSGLTQQDVRDAMTLPATGAAQPGSIDQAIKDTGDLVVAFAN